MYYHRHEDTVSRSDDDRCECSFYTTTPTNEGWDKWDVQFTEDPKRRRRHVSFVAALTVLTSADCRRDHLFSNKKKKTYYF